MKLDRSSWLGRYEGITMATFGEARLMKKLDGKIELIGGSAENRSEAKEWISLFLPEAVVTDVSEEEPRSPSPIVHPVPFRPAVSPTS